MVYLYQIKPMRVSHLSIHFSEDECSVADNELVFGQSVALEFKEGRDWEIAFPKKMDESPRATLKSFKILGNSILRCI